MTVSHVMATKDRFRFLHTALSHAESYVSPDDEFVVVNGGESFPPNPIIDVLIEEPDESSIEALNKGIMAASGDFIHIVTDDDWYNKEALRVAYVKAAKHGVDGLVCGGIKTKVMPNGAWGPLSPKCIPLGVDYGSSIESIARYGAPGVGFVLKRQSVIEVGMFSDVPLSDIDMMIRFVAGSLAVKFLRVNAYTHPIYPHSLLSDRKRLIEGWRQLTEDYGCQANLAPEWQIPPEWDGKFA